MERRQLLRWGGGSLIFISASSWLAGCSKKLNSAPVPASLDQDQQQAIELDFAGALARARSLGKPLLVFVAPPTFELARRDSRQTFADFLSSADDQLWTDLALCELVCASPSEFWAATKIELGKTPLLVVIEHEASGPRIAATVDSDVTDSSWGCKSKEEWLSLQKQRFEAWTKTIHDAISGGSKDLRRRAADAREALGPAACARVDDCIRSAGKPSPAVLIGAASLFLEADAQHGDAEHWREQVIDSLRSRVLKQGFSGAGWASSSGCGCEQEDPTRSKQVERVAIACGIAMIDEYSSRFLWFYTDGAR